jgi:hypothetical protein
VYFLTKRFKALQADGKEPVYGKVSIVVLAQVEEILGPAGGMLSQSKRTPPGLEGHNILWNACVFDADGREIWWGDLDATAKEDELATVAKVLGQRIYVTPEQPFRFHGLKDGLKSYNSDRVIVFEP